MEHKWKYEIYINGEWNSEYRLTAKEIKEVEKSINKIIKGRTENVRNKTIK